MSASSFRVEWLEYETQHKSCPPATHSSISHTLSYCSIVWKISQSLVSHILTISSLNISKLGSGNLQNFLSSDSTNVSCSTFSMNLCRQLPFYYLCSIYSFQFIKDVHYRYRKLWPPTLTWVTWEILTRPKIRCLLGYHASLVINSTLLNKEI